MNRKDDGSHGTDLIGMLIGVLGAVCIWIAIVGFGGAGDGWILNPEGALRWFDGQHWVDTDEGGPIDRRLVVLVHGLDEPGGIWDDVAPALFGAGYRVVRFDYPNDQSIVTSAHGLSLAMDRLAAVGIEHASIIAHSMGGLVSREAITNSELGDTRGMIGSAHAGIEIDRLILVGTPNEGSVWAKLRGVAEARERLQRWATSDDLDPTVLASLGRDGDGQAGVDLRPGSVFLAALNARPMPSDVPVTCIIGRMIDPLQTIGNASLDDTADALGDGVVSVESASLDGCDDVVLLVANHRTMLRVMELAEGWRAMVGADRGEEPSAIPVILDRLGRLEQ